MIYCRSSGWSSGGRAFKDSLEDEERRKRRNVIDKCHAERENRRFSIELSSSSTATTVLGVVTEVSSPCLHWAEAGMRMKWSDFNCRKLRSRITETAEECVSLVVMGCQVESFLSFFLLLFSTWHSPHPSVDFISILLPSSTSFIW